MHIPHKAGDKMFVDFTGEKLNYLNVITGEILEAEVFVAILGASQYMHAEAVEGQQIEDFIGMQPLDAQSRAFLVEIIEDRHR